MSEKLKNILASYTEQQSACEALEKQIRQKKLDLVAKEESLRQKTAIETELNEEVHILKLHTREENEQLRQLTEGTERSRCEKNEVFSKLKEMEEKAAEKQEILAQSKSEILHSLQASLNASISTRIKIKDELALAVSQSEKN